MKNKNQRISNNTLRFIEIDKYGRLIRSRDKLNLIKTSN